MNSSDAVSAFLGLNCLPIPCLQLEGWLPASGRYSNLGAWGNGGAQPELSIVVAGGPGSRVTSHCGVAGIVPDEAHPGIPSCPSTWSGWSPYWISFLFYRFFNALGPCPLSIDASCPEMRSPRVQGDVQNSDLEDFGFVFSFETSSSNSASLQTRALRETVQGLVSVSRVCVASSGADVLTGRALSRVSVLSCSSSCPPPGDGTHFPFPVQTLQADVGCAIAV